MSTPRCPICERPIPAQPPEGESPSPPFCSRRCKLIDLGNWLDGAYRIPGPPAWVDEGDDGSGHLPS